MSTAENSAEMVERAEFFRLDVGRSSSEEKRAELGQFLTPAPVARFMASLADCRLREVRLLDPGAGVGTLSAAWIEAAVAHPKPPRRIHLTAYEIDSTLIPYLRETVENCRDLCRQAGVDFAAEIVVGDFIEGAAELLGVPPLFGSSPSQFDAVIVNPPYRKIHGDSEARRMLRSAGIQTSNLYSGFLWLALKLLAPGGEIVAITPRSFCNGPYFRPFREALLGACAITRIHVFDSRKSAFRDAAVLQENVIFRAVRTTDKSGPTAISTSNGPDDPDVRVREMKAEQLVAPHDRERVIHIVPDDLGGQVAERIKSFASSLREIGVEVSTGRVVDFRAKEHLVAGCEVPVGNGATAPLIYPLHFDHGAISWPREGKKPNHLRINRATESLLVPVGIYVLVKRFSAKEEKRRVSAAMCHPNRLPQVSYAFENHLNYFHENGEGLPPLLAKGLAAYLNSGLLDAYFRQFSGHTQVNASDLRSLPYPSREALERIGASIGDTMPPQNEIDILIKRELPTVAAGPDPLLAQQRIDEVLLLLKSLGLPRAQQNTRSALTLLALLDIRPETPWAEARSPVIGITPIMNFAEEHYGTTYAPNTRETFRRQTMHQFVEAAIALYNPDDPARAVNSPKAAYQVNPLLLDVLRAFGKRKFGRLLKEYLAKVESLKARYARERTMMKIPLRLPGGATIELSPGGQNVLVEQIIHEFCPRFTPGGVPLYVGDTEEKDAFFDRASLDALGVTVDAHGKMPDVVIHDQNRNWLVLVEAVTSHGPVDGKRHDELKRLFAESTAPLVFVTAFMDRAAMGQFLCEIAWETEVWGADAPSHMIHFNGGRFLGPYEER